ncbi:MAG: tRNA dihydrouridine(20/20a) synthase DusA [Pseudomonadota bacterium]
MKTGLLPDATLCVAPMMAWTDRHCRTLHRLLSPRALLFTEMVTANALLHGDPEHLLRHGAHEHPVALQLGGSDPADLARAAQLGAAAGFQELNLNVGCPSDRVQRGRFGACLMREPALVADCIAAMMAATPLPVTVKCRLGVDELDNDEWLSAFIEALLAVGLPRLYLHARKAILKGLSPAQNRHIPPLQYERVYRMKAQFPTLPIIINGGIDSVAATRAHLAQVDGVMIGRAAFQHPALLAAIEHDLATVDASETTLPGPGGAAATGATVRLTQDELLAVLQEYRSYAIQELAQDIRLADLTRPLLGLFHAVPGARRYRRLLSDSARLKTGHIEVLDEACSAIAQGRRAA